MALYGALDLENNYILEITFWTNPYDDGVDHGFIRFFNHVKVTFMAFFTANFNGF